MLLILAVTQTLKQLVNMYKVTKQWQLNQYMERLVRDGLIYFLVYVAVFYPRSFPSSTVTNSHPFFSRVCADKLTTRLFSFSLLGTCFTIFVV